MGKNGFYTYPKLPTTNSLKLHFGYRKYEKIKEKEEEENVRDIYD